MEYGYQRNWAKQLFDKGEPIYFLVTVEKDTGEHIHFISGEFSRGPLQDLARDLERRGELTPVAIWKVSKHIF